MVLEPHLEAVVAFEVRHIQFAAWRHDALMNLVDHALLPAAEAVQMRHMDFLWQADSFLRAFNE